MKMKKMKEKGKLTTSIIGPLSKILPITNKKYLLYLSNAKCFKHI
jgi:hypothetical protein